MPVEKALSLMGCSLNNKLSILKTGVVDLKADRRFYKRLKTKKPTDLDQMVSAYHDEVFQEINCLECANCCKTTSPVFRDIDIDKIARFLKIRPSDLTARHLHLDDENDYVLNTAPCLFLDDTNHCRIYEVRPAACRDYPHTNRKRFYQVIDKTIRNLTVCPAVVKVTEKLKNYYK